MQSATAPERKKPSGAARIDGPEREAILSELERILSSPSFKSSSRSKQFLGYVVHHILDGNEEPLKERTLGTKLFDRAPGYSTGDDPVVRVQAGEVRRRLEQYHHASVQVPPVRIDLPVGSYTPEFQWIEEKEAAEAAIAVEPPATATTAIEVAPAPAVESEPSPRRKTPWLRLSLFILLCAALAAVVIVAIARRAGPPKSASSLFWQPVLETSEPVLICLAKPTVYLPSRDLLQKHSKQPEAFSTELGRLTEPTPMKPDDKLVWGDLVEYGDYGVAAGDVYAAVRLSSLFGQLKKPSQVRIGTNYSFADLRNSPAIVVGAFNNRWTMQMTSNLHFAFVEENGTSLIREQGTGGRAWYAKFGRKGEVVEDYGIVTRLLNSKTGQFVVSTAGILSDGTQAASEFVSNPQNLEEALRSAPPEWAGKNLQFVVHTTVTDSVPGPPQVVAFYMW